MSGGEGRGERGTRYSTQKAKGTKKGQVTKMPGLYKQEPVGRTAQPLAGEFRVEGGVCQPYPVTGRD